jgi:hypothetical protein
LIRPDPGISAQRPAARAGHVSGGETLFGTLFIIILVIIVLAIIGALSVIRKVL